jgi:hypothetical protein
MASSRLALSHRNTSTAPHRHSRSSRKAMLRTACSRCAPRSCSAGSSGVLAAVSTWTDAIPTTTSDTIFESQMLVGSGNKCSFSARARLLYLGTTHAGRHREGEARIAGVRYLVRPPRHNSPRFSFQTQQTLWAFQKLEKQKLL